MSTAKHTAGPWKIIQYVNHEGFSIWGGDGCLVERWYNISRTEEQNVEMKANADLISAAPELLEATKQYVSTPQTCACLPDSDCAEAVARQKARAAIAKAEGV